LSKRFGVNLLLQPGKGYSLNVNRKTNISIPAILAEAKVAITPMNGFTRFAGTMEISGINHKINKSRVRAITQASKKYYPQLDFTNDEFSNVKCGLRPVTPDGLPYIGRSSKCKNLIFATGHAMMGWGMGTATGLAVSEILDYKKTSINIDHYRPDRKF
jgi:D-amino-acid dehydrogenase